MNTQTGEEVAIKLEHMNAKHPQLHIEYKLYGIMKGRGNLPWLHKKWKQDCKVVTYILQ